MIQFRETIDNVKREESDSGTHRQRESGDENNSKASEIHPEAATITTNNKKGGIESLRSPILTRQRLVSGFSEHGADVHGTPPFDRFRGLGDVGEGRCIAVHDNVETVERVFGTSGCGEHRKAGGTGCTGGTGNGRWRHGCSCDVVGE